MFNKIPKNYFLALATFIGYIVGVGMFGLPFIMSKSGVLPFVLLLIGILLIQYVIHLIYANVIIATDTYHQLPGYAGIYLGRTGKYVVFVANLFSNIGALIAYIIVNGKFLSQLLAPYYGGSEFFYATLIFALEAFVVYYGMKMVAKTEIVMMTALFVAIGMITWHGLPIIKAENYLVIDWRYLLLPYGAMFFSLDGSGCLPVLAKLLNKDKAAMKSVIRYGLGISALILFSFVMVIVGISGSTTTDDALTGVKFILDNSVVFFALIFGILAIITSFLGLAESMEKILSWDFKINRKLAWAITVFVPYILYAMGINNLVVIISFVGAIGGGLGGIILVLIFLKMEKMKNKLPIFNKLKPSKKITSFLIFTFITGMVFELYYKLFGKF